VPDAIFVNLEDLPKISDRLRFIEFMKVLNVKLTDLAVCYDSDGNSAFKFAYTIEAMGHKNVGVLDGGLDFWVSSGFKIVEENQENSKIYDEFGYKLNPSKIILLPEIKNFS
jgi:3-mercaptopyruvate sulfurtransferase SseA